VEPRKVIITLAPTGGYSNSANVPTQPKEIADQVAECAELGAAIAHLHARKPDGAPTTDPNIYREINRLVRERCDIIINNSSAGGFTRDLAEQVAPGQWDLKYEERFRVLEAGAEMASLSLQTVVAVGGGDEILFRNTPSGQDALAKAMREKNIKPELEVWGLSEVGTDLPRLINTGVDRPPHLTNLLMGYDAAFRGAIGYSPKILQLLVDMLPANCQFNVSGWQEAQLPAITQAILLGGNIRVGLEDNSQYSPGVPATNRDLVRRAVRIIRELNCEPATPAEARQILALPTLVVA
jgi:3-keto-5-aminohexanoate cleavage enzyme